LDIMKFYKKILKNGMTVLFEQREVPVTTVMLAARYGSAYESEKEKGMAHFIEHLCFKGTEKRSAKEIAFELEKVGGILNAFTSEEVTAYHVKLPSNHLKLAIDVIFDIFFNPVFPEEEVKKEANVICEEIRMYYDNPRAHVVEKLKDNLYKKPFGMSIAGTEKNVLGMDRDFLLKKHREIYCSENAVLVVVGNNDFDEICELAEKYSAVRGFAKQNKPKIETHILKETENRDNLQQANVAIGFHFPKSSEKERYAAEIFATILGQGMSSKLFTEVREKRGLAYAVKTELDSGDDYGYMAIYIGTDKEKVNEVIKICVEEFKKMKDLSEKELKEGKEQVLGNKKVEEEGSDVVAVDLLSEELFGKAENYYNFEEKISAVSLEDVKKLAEKSEYATFVLAP